MARIFIENFVYLLMMLIPMLADKEHRLNVGLLANTILQSLCLLVPIFTSVTTNKYSVGLWTRFSTTHFFLSQSFASRDRTHRTNFVHSFGNGKWHCFYDCVSINYCWCWCWCWRLMRLLLSHFTENEG